MGDSGQVWWVCNFLTQTPTQPAIKKKKFVTQPNPPNPKS